MIYRLNHPTNWRWMPWVEFITGYYVSYFTYTCSVGTNNKVGWPISHKTKKVLFLTQVPLPLKFVLNFVVIRIEWQYQPWCCWRQASVLLRKESNGKHDLRAASHFPSFLSTGPQMGGDLYTALTIILMYNDMKTRLQLAK